MTKNKTVTAIALILISTFAISLVALPAANAHDPKWTIVSYAYIVPAPNPVGVNQKVSIVMWVDTPLPGATVDNTFHTYLTKPARTPSSLIMADKYTHGTIPFRVSSVLLRQIRGRTIPSQPPAKLRR